MSLCSTQNSLATALAYLGQEGEAGALFASCARGVERLFADVEEGHRPPFATACAQGLQRLKRSQSKHRKRQGTANATTTTNATKARDSKARGPT